MLFSRIFFDMDGTLVDSKPGIINSVVSALRDFGIQAAPEKLTKVVGPPLRYSFMTFFGFTEENVDQVIKVYRSYYSATGVFENSLYPGVVAMLEELDRAGKEIILATSKEEDYARQILNNYHMTQLFSFVGGADLASGRLSKAEVLRHICTAHKVTDMEPCVMVGDREHDVHGAHELGMQCAAVLYGYGSEQELRQAGAEYVLPSVSELKRWLLQSKKKS